MISTLPIVVLLLLVTHSCAAETTAAPVCAQAPGAERIDCYPPVANFPNATEEACLAQGCCWKPLDNGGVPCAFDLPESPGDARCAAVPSASRFECRNPRYFSAFNDKSTCHDVGCCFDDDSNECFQPFFEGYELLTLEEVADGWRGTLVLKRFARGPFGNDVPLLALHVIRESQHRVRVRITDPSFPRYEVPDVLGQELNTPGDNESSSYKVQFTEKPFGIAVTRKDTGEVLFNSTPPMDNKEFFNGLVFENQFLEISTQLHDDNADEADDGPVLYGLGERVAPLRLNADAKGDHYPMFARDQPADTPHTREGGDNLYGVHPFYMQLLGSGRAHGVFLLSSNAMEVVTQRDALTYRTTGGVIDLFIFAGPTPQEVISQYTELVGKPEMPPYWALGYHLGHWGTKSVDESVSLATKMRDKGIPLEALWLDIDYMDDRKSFTLDEDHFPRDKLQRFVNDLHFHNQYFVAIHTPAINSEDLDPERRQEEDSLDEEDARVYTMSLNVSTSKTTGSLDKCEPLRQAKEMDVLVKGVQGETFAEKYLWSGWSVFVDFFHPNASQYWFEQLASFHDTLVPFDGLWLDMNEPSSSCDFAFADDANACPEHAAVALERRRSRKTTDNDEDYEPSDEITLESLNGDVATTAGDDGFIRSSDVAFPFDPYRQPFAPGQNTLNRGGHGNLNSATLPMAALHHTSLHYNLHSLYGHAAARATRKVMDRVLAKRSLLLSRSTFSGSGQFTGHWLGNNAATWENLQLSIAGVLQMNLLGVPLTGPNVCGYEGDASKELCVRWHQAVAFFPLLRNHARKHTTSQAPVDFDGQAVNILRDTLLQRYRYLPYMYTQFYKAHVGGEPVVRSLMVEFPEDKGCQMIAYQYLLGKALMVSPVVEKGAISTRVYFPKNATWYDAENGKVVDFHPESKDRTLNLLTPLNRLQLHVRGGHILPMQQPATTTTMSRRGDFTLLVALSSGDEHDHPHALGELFVDDGDSIDSVEDERFSLIQFDVSQNASDRLDFKSTVVTHGYDGPEMHVDLKEIRIYGLSQGFRANSSLLAILSTGNGGARMKKNAMDMEKRNGVEGDQSVRIEYFANAKMLVLSDLKMRIGQTFHVQVGAKPGKPDHVPEDAKDADASSQQGSGDGEDKEGNGGIGRQKEKAQTGKHLYSVLTIIGCVVGVLFLLGILVYFFLQRRGSSGYNPIA